MLCFKKKHIFFFKGTRTKLWNEYKSFTEIPKLVHGKNSGIIKLEKSKEPVKFDSELEKEVLLSMDNCTFIKEIKTQSLEIIYKGKGGKKDHQYIPDIQLLQYGGTIIIVEVKPFREMVNNTVLRKTKALRAYCKEKGYGHAIVDIIGNQFYTFEDLKKENVSKDIQDKFIEFVKGKEEVTYPESKPFKEEYDINDKQICKIIWKNKRKLKYQQHKIMIKK